MWGDVCVPQPFVGSGICLIPSFVSENTVGVVVFTGHSDCDTVDSSPINWLSSVTLSILS